MDIYDTGSLKNAFGIYSSERSPDTTMWEPAQRSIGT